MLNYLSGSELIYLGISVPYSGPFVDVHFNVALHASVSHEYLISHISEINPSSVLRPEHPTEHGVQRSD